MLLCPVRIRTVSIHTPIQGVTDLWNGIGRTKMFQSTHPYRVWLGFQVKLLFFFSFQSTHPYRVWLIPEMDSIGMQQFQSTHPYRVWPKVHRDPRRHWDVSIHTPIQGVTRSAWGWMSPFPCFNPHTHTGCDSYAGQHYAPGGVSIHTPIQGVTKDCGLKFADMEFQSTHPYRVWHYSSYGVNIFNKFQSTHPYRVWHSRRGGSMMVSSFNPHTHTGCDRTLGICALCQLVSIHTPIQGVTSSCSMVCIRRQVSIHTPIQGVTFAPSFIF